MQRIVTIYESFRNTIRQKISKLTSKLLSFPKRPRSKFYRSFSCSSFSCFVHSPYQPPLILLNHLFVFALYVRFLYISRQRGKSVDLLFISSCLLHEFVVVTFTAKIRLRVLTLATPRTHLSKHLVISNIDKIVYTHGGKITAYNPGLLSCFGQIRASSASAILISAFKFKAICTKYLIKKIALKKLRNFRDIE